MTGQNVSYSMLSYRDTDVGAYHPLILQKRLVTGAAKGDFPQGVSGGWAGPGALV